MIQVAPSLLSADFARLGDELARTEQSGADLVHFDVMDGVFVPNISFGLPVLASIRKHSRLPFDVHLMIADPLRYVQRFAEAGADGITFHVESESDTAACLRAIRSAGKRTGLSLRPGTAVDALFPYLEDTDLVLVMTVEPGFGGQSFLSPMLEKIAALREYAERHGLSYEIEVDGGINRETGKLCADAGAGILVAGSYLYGAADMKAAVTSLKG